MTIKKKKKESKLVNLNKKQHQTKVIDTSPTTTTVLL